MSATLHAPTRRRPAPGRAAVARYLGCLERAQPSPTRARTVLETARRRERDAGDVLERLAAVQKRLEADSALEQLALAERDRSAAETDFVAVAAAWGAARGISWAAWREVGVPAKVLRAAGITRSAPTA